MSEVLEGEVVEEVSPIPYELDGEKKLALIGLNEAQMVFIVHGLHTLAGHLKDMAEGGEEAAKTCEAFFYQMREITKEVRAL